MERTNEAILKAAEMKYKEGISLIGDMCEAQKGKHSESFYNDSIVHFDSVLQGIILCIALEEGTLMDNDRYFISKVTSKGRILSGINSTGKRRYYGKWKTLNWDNVDKEDLAFDKLIEVVDETLDGVVLDFIQPFAKLDRDISSESFIDRLSDLVVDIITAIFVSDGDDPKSDRVKASVSKGIKLINDTMRLQWESMESKKQSSY